MTTPRCSTPSPNWNGQIGTECWNWEALVGICAENGAEAPKVSVSATDFTSPPAAPIAADSVRYSVGPIEQIRGAVTYIDNSPVDLTIAVPAITATGVSGDNAAATTWNPTISVIVPAGAVAGVYTSSITHSVA